MLLKQLYMPHPSFEDSSFQTQKGDFYEAWLYTCNLLMKTIDCFDALHPSQQVFSDDGTISCLPGLIRYKTADKVFCSMT